MEKRKRGAGRGAIHIITPTARPLESLAASLTRGSESVTATSTLMDDMQKEARSLRLYVKKVLSNSGETNLLLVVDQFEEVFTLCKDPVERKAFIENLLSLVDGEHHAAQVILTLRADFYHQCAEYEGLRQALEKHQAYIGAMTQDELREAIIQPAEKNGWDFQPGLVDLVLRDVGTEPGALPLLSHALLETWKRRQGRTLTLQGYHDAGGVKKAITQTAEGVYDHFSPEEQTIARGIFLRLTELGEGVQDTRRRARLDELSRAADHYAMAKVLKTLIDARLVTTEQDSAEVAHEALIREWGTLRKWLDEDRESLRLHRHLTESAQEWQRRGREVSELYRGARLGQIQEWVKQHGEGLSSLESEFVRASQNVRKQERLRWVGIAGVGVVLLMMVILGATGQLNRFIFGPVDMEAYWVTIPAGEFLMGSSDEQIADALKTCSGCDFSNEQPQHWVDLAEYQIGKYEVTSRQFVQCVKAGICAGSADVGESKDLHPVVNVTWDDANKFCEWVGGRLPTEAEWEKAASWTAETKTKSVYPWGDDIDCSFANYNGKDNGSDYCVGETTPVGSYETGKSPYGLYDMAGNVWEWVNDWYAETYYQGSPSSNPSGPDSGDLRLQRGGAWYTVEVGVRSAYRYRYYPSSAGDYVGFRCSRSP
ncbi:MAG: formylglycine-generating enzyme family protein [Anaerolineales bacterium]